MRCYQENGKTVVPINPKEAEIEGIPCLANLAALDNPSDVAVSVITPPSTSRWTSDAIITQSTRVSRFEVLSAALGLRAECSVRHVLVFLMTEVTVGILEEAAKLGISKIWLQPGCEDDSVISKQAELGLKDVIYGGPCVLVELGFGDHS